MKLREVLVLDDSDADLLYSRLMVEAAGVAGKVSTFETGPEVLAYLQRAEGHQVDLILLDINMPEMNGFEFLDAYQRLHRAQQARAVVVMLTNSPDPAERARAQSFDCVKGYVVKPIDRAAVAGLVALAAAAAPRD
ncbi:MAG TPA: response regulator [Burkholderiaceae bacterium]|nr:response regulator [Burkholderiaceae bacterium]